jgi:hypothetical protein
MPEVYSGGVEVGFDSKRWVRLGLVRYYRKWDCLLRDRLASASVCPTATDLLQDLLGARRCGACVRPEPPRPRLHSDQDLRPEAQRRANSNRRSALRTSDGMLHVAMGRCMLQWNAACCNGTLHVAMGRCMLQFGAACCKSRAKKRGPGYHVETASGIEDAVASAVSATYNTAHARCNIRCTVAVQHANMQKRRLIASEVKASHSCTGAPRAVVMKQQSPGSAQAGPSRVCTGRAEPGLHSAEGGRGRAKAEGKA